MFNYYLYNTSYENETIDNIETSLKVLNEIAIDEKKDYDNFLIHESIWAIKTVSGSFVDVVFSHLNDKQFSIQVLPRLFQTITTIDNPINSLDEFDKVYRLYNAFYGIDFKKVYHERHIDSKQKYQDYHNSTLKKINGTLLWQHRETIFKKIVLCPQIEQHLEKIGEAYTAQILARLLELDRYLTNYWGINEFDYRDANCKTSLRMSPESSKTMSQEKLYNLRKFKMPDGSIECCDLHIKTGNLRFHFFPKDKHVFIGYIGPHLKTADT